jgi:hypothetical protein
MDPETNADTEAESGRSLEDAGTLLRDKDMPR